MPQSARLKNIARGGGSYHSHRLEIVRDIIENPSTRLDNVSPFLLERLYRISPTRTIFAFGEKDWELCARLLSVEDAATEARLLELVVQNAAINLESICRLIALGDQISLRLLRKDPIDVTDRPDLLAADDAQSLFALRVKCAQNNGSTDAMRNLLREALPSGWAKTSLISPLIYHFSHRPPATILDQFLSYLVTGEEHVAEKLTLKLLLSDEAARDASLSFKIYVGLMAHPYDAIEFVLDHIEFKLLEPAPLPLQLRVFLERMALMLPGSRAARMHELVSTTLRFVEGTVASGIARSFEMSEAEVERYAQICDLAPLAPEMFKESAMRPFDILTNMRVQEYPNAAEFQLIVAEKDNWFFLEAGRFIGALLRSIYMIERAHRDLEARSVLRLLCILGISNPYTASTPSGMFALRALAEHGALSRGDVALIEAKTQDAIVANSPFGDRLWINELQWNLRRLEEQGRVADWLAHVRKHTRVRPSYLTGINWHWVEEIVQLQRLRPFKSFDGAYLFLHMELEANADPLRLRIVLDPLIRGLRFKEIVERIIEEFGTAAPAIVRRHLTPQNLLASGLAPSYVAALDQRVRALEACIKRFEFGPLLTEELYESEVRTLTAELLLTSVNTGKFELPWEIFRKDAFEAQQDLYLAYDSLRPHAEASEQLTGLFESTVSFTNGRSQSYKLRRRDGPMFALLSALILGFMQHPAFGLEVILSGRFRHNILLQELWNALTAVESAMIQSVPTNVQSALIADYSQATELFIDDWCSIYMQTRRSEKPDGMFNLVPEQKELDQLLIQGSQAKDMLEIIDLVVEWIKERLRAQVAEAKTRFSHDVIEGLKDRFTRVRDAQLAAGTYRAQDITKVHTAVSDAIARRVEDLQSWFDGVDTTSSGVISLEDLSMAAEALFENMMPGRNLVAVTDAGAHDVLFEAAEVKIAFDLLREIYFNALKHGVGPDVTLTLQQVEDTTCVSYSFSNDADPASDDLEKVVEGSRYENVNDALFRDRNSGLAKVAASSATLIGQDSSVHAIRKDGRYHVSVPLKPASCDGLPK